MPKKGAPKDDRFDKYIGNPDDIKIAGMDVDLTPTDVFGEMSMADLVDYTGNAEEDAKREISLIEEMMKAADAREVDRMDYALDAGFFCCLIFLTEAQRDSFIEAVGMADETVDYQYVDGIELANKLGVKIMEVPPIADQRARIDAEYRDLAM